MAITAHYLVNEANSLALRCRLIAFRVLHGSHTGVRMADLCMEVFEEFEITEKVCRLANVAITLDVIPTFLDLHGNT